MTPETPTSNQEKRPKITTVPPAGESLLHLEVNNLWPDNIRQNPELHEQAKIRTELLRSLTSVYELLPIDTNIQEVFENGIIHENDIVELYDRISNMLESDSCADRFILYMPFEILPNKEWKTDSEMLNNSKDRFIDTYMKAWNNLLSIEDVRANFTDGDFTDEEVNSKEFPRVVKVAHLVSKLIEKKLVSFQEIVTLIQNNSGSELARSMIEGLSIAESSGLLASYEEEMLIQMRENNSRSRNEKKDFNISKSRQTWLDIDAKRKELEKKSDEIVKNILSGDLSQEDFRNKYFISGDLEMNMTGITALRKVIEYFSKDNIQTSKDIYKKFETDLFKFWTSENLKIKDIMIGMWSYFKVIDIVDQEYLYTHNIKIPSLEEDTIGRKNELKQDINTLNSCLEQIAMDPELSASLYQASIFFGSRVKGYGLSDSDFDIAIFVRPETDIESRNVLRNKISNIFKEKNMNVKPVEFWLDENMLIKNLSIEDELVCDSSVVDSLFSGIMSGDDETIKMLYEKLLSQYLYSENKDSRQLQLQDLERNNLQYRLMHRGYRYFFPKQGKDIRLSVVESLDKESVFWDAGYRRLASKIFVNKVFLPQLHK